jgi:hypothetical protein
MIDKNEIAKGLRDLFKYAFVTNCHLDDDEITHEETLVINSFDSIDLLENFKDLILNLLKFKKEFKNSEKKQNISNEFIETLVKKHETQVQNHIHIENDLKHQLENALKREETFKKNYENTLSQLKTLEQSNHYKIAKNWETLNKESQEKIAFLSTKIESKDKSIRKLEEGNSKLKSILEQKFIECEIVKKTCINCQKPSQRIRNIKSSFSIDITKKQLVEKATELVSNQQKLRESISRSPLRDFNKKTLDDEGRKPELKVFHWRSLSENDF